MATDRMIDPNHQPNAYVERRLGVKTSGAIEREIDRGKRYEPRIVAISADSIYWHRANIGGSGDAAYGMRLATPSSDSAWAMTNIPWPAPAACRVVRLHLWSSEARTGGTATVRLRVIDAGGTNDYTFAGCQLSASPTQISTLRIPWAQALRISEGATVEARILTAGTFGPNTADMTLVMCVAYEDEI